MTTAALVFAGILVSLVITFIKSAFKTNGVDSLGPTGSMLIVVLVSLIGASIYVALTHFGYWDTFVKVLTIAGAFYAYIIKNMQDSVPSQSEN